MEQESSHRAADLKASFVKLNQIHSQAVVDRDFFLAHLLEMALAETKSLFKAASGTTGTADELLHDL